MARLLDIFGFLSILLRALTLSLSAIVIGGISFRHLVAGRVSEEDAPDLGDGRRIISGVAVGLVIAQGASLFANAAILADTEGISPTDIFGASFFLWGCASIGAATLLAFRSADRRLKGYVPVLAALVILSSTVATSHAVARLDHRPVLLLATAAHQAATACWIGGLPFLLVSLAAAKDSASAYFLCRRFSLLAIVSVCVLASAGIVMSCFYVGSVSALYGTNYGLMLIGKVILFAMVLLLGSFNRSITRQLRRGDTNLLFRLRRFGEAEIGIGITAILTAASLTSQPPAVDLASSAVTWPVIAERMSPKLPLMKTPPLATLSPSSMELWKKQHEADATPGQTFVPGESDHPSTQGDIEWSEYNHHWAGLLVLAMGFLAVLSRFAHMRWASHWPLVFVGLAAFIFFRADPENWPLGPNGFWESFSSADVTQHRLFVVLILLFAAFEWGVQTSRLNSVRAALVFPLICAIGGAMLVTHTHALSNPKEQLLVEFSHLPLALLAVAAGWARWLELRLPGSGRVLAGRIWPVCFALIGVVLLLYREA